MRLAILDDYAHLALRLADWSRLEGRCTIEVFDRPLGTGEDAVRALAPFDISAICASGWRCLAHSSSVCPI